MSSVDSGNESPTRTPLRSPLMAPVPAEAAASSVEAATASASSSSVSETAASPSATAAEQQPEVPEQEAVASATEAAPEVEESAAGEDKKGDNETGSDSGHNSVVDESQVMSYEFQIPRSVCGRLIGVRGTTVNQLRIASGCTITLLEMDGVPSRPPGGGGRQHKTARYRKGADVDAQTCVVTGTSAQIERCLELIRERFPVSQFPEVTLNQTNSGNVEFTLEMHSPFNYLFDGEMRPVKISHIESAGRFSVQLPDHYSFPALSSLQKCLYDSYNQLPSPPVLDPPPPGLVCVVRAEDRTWYRCRVDAYHPDTGRVDCWRMDYGGSLNVHKTALRTIRLDYLKLPFQAVQVYLSNVQTLDGVAWTEEARAALEAITKDKNLSGHMMGVAHDQLPLLELYVEESPAEGDTEPKSVMVNRQMVELGHAQWYEYELKDE